MFDYLNNDLLTAGRLRADLDVHVHAVAEAWIAAAVDPSAIEVMAEALARLASEARAAEVALTVTDVTASLAWLALTEPVMVFLSAALQRGCAAERVAAVAVHLLDIAERMALLVFIPELPSLAARADRSGAAARRVGTARHLRG